MKVRFWKQHSMESCGIACALMILDAFGVDYPTIGKEQALYRRFRARCTPGTLGGSVAQLLTRHGLQVTLAHAEREMMVNRGGYYPPELHAQILAEHREAIERAGARLTLRVGQPITADWLRAELAGERLVIVEVIVPGDADGMHDEVLHGILLTGAEDGVFLACDPLQGRIRLTEAELLAAMDTPLGAMAISAGRNTGGE
ncbi:MAG: hypothetical protein IJE07_11050 [Clostridia bacterium]|nr:hypothetical protein [Clostridia bacterium]